MRATGEPEESASRTGHLISGIIDTWPDADCTLPWD
jgi:hypothetical protein